MRDLARILGVGLILVTCSEIWFYPVPLAVDQLLTLAFYALAGAVMLAALARFPDTGRAGLIVAAGMMGFVIEGIPVPVLYSNLPFSIVWTSLAWHALLSVGCGVVGLRLVLAGPVLPAALVVALGGAALGLWGGYFWTAELAVPAPETFAPQFLTGFAALVAGHALLDAAAGPSPVARRWTEVALALAIAALWLLGWAVPLFPVSLLLPVLLAISLWALARGHGRGVALTPLVRRLPWRAYAILPLMPAVALPVFAATQGRGWEVNAWWALTTAPVAVALWLGALMLLGRGRRT